MRPHGQTKLGFFPLPIAEARRLKNCLVFPEGFSVLDPCIGDGVAFAHLLRDAPAHRFGIEIDAYRNKHEPWESKPFRQTQWMCAARPNPCRCCT